MALLACLTWGLAAGGLAWAVAQIVTAPRVVSAELGRFEEERRETLRADSDVFRWFEPWIDELAGFVRKTQSARLPQLRDDLIGAGADIAWTPEEHLATKQVESIVAGLIGVFFGSVLGGYSLALFFGAFGLFAYQYYASWSLRSQSLKRRRTIRRRLAPAIELQALMMEVGSGFQESLQAVAEEAGSHPLGVELRRVLRDLSLGRPRVAALSDFSERLADDDTRDLMAAIIQGEELGTPLAETMRTQAEQLRQKRSQWAEKAAEESKVALVFPAMLIMAACLAIVVAPFVLSAFYVAN